MSNPPTGVQTNGVGKVELQAKLHAADVRRRLFGSAKPCHERSPQPKPIFIPRSTPRPVAVEFRPKAHRPLSNTAKEIVAQEIAAAGIGSEDFFSLSRTKHIALARQKAAYRIRLHTFYSTPQIAKAVGYMDHTTVIHAVRKVASMMEARDGA